MSENNKFDLTLLVSVNLGAIAETIQLMESAIDESIRIVVALREDDPENASVPAMLDLFVSAKDLIRAHKMIKHMADLMQTGGMQQDGPPSVQ